MLLPPDPVTITCEKGKKEGNEGRTEREIYVCLSFATKMAVFLPLPSRSPGYFCYHFQ